MVISKNTRKSKPKTDDSNTDLKSGNYNHKYYI